MVWYSRGRVIETDLGICIILLLVLQNQYVYYNYV